MVDASTLIGKNLAGYQGWFGTPNDGQNDGWGHWFAGGGPDAAHAMVDLWPDVRELGDDELEATSMRLPNGQPARLFSSHHPRTVLRHFAWMQQYGIDGVSLGRFVAGTTDARTLAKLDHVLAQVCAGAEATGRVWFVWYDVTGQDSASLATALQTDLLHLYELGVMESPAWLHHRGKPLIGIWGAGDIAMPGDPDDWEAIVDFFKLDTTLLLGGPRAWQTDPIMSQADVVSPWAVTAFGDEAGADVYRRTVLKPDLALTRARGQDYLPIIWPGFSWSNMQRGASQINAIPRQGGRFYWRQIYNTVEAGATCLMTAMFDEYDEGTAIAKAAETQADVPVQGTWLSLDADGEQVSSDFYLRLAGAAGQMLRGEIQLSDTIPISKEQRMTLDTAIVKDAKGQPVPNALVQWWDQNGRSDARTTDGNGFVHFGATSPGTFTWACWANGFSMANGYVTADTTALAIEVSPAGSFRTPKP